MIGHALEEEHFILMSLLVLSISRLQYLSPLHATGRSPMVPIPTPNSLLKVVFYVLGHYWAGPAFEVKIN